MLVHGERHGCTVHLHPAPDPSISRRGADNQSYAVITVKYMKWKEPFDAWLESEKSGSTRHDEGIVERKQMYFGFSFTFRPPSPDVVSLGSSGPLCSPHTGWDGAGGAAGGVLLAVSSLG